MKATTEKEIKVSGGRITGAKVTDEGTCILTIEVDATSEIVEDAKNHETRTDEQTINETGIFKLVEASKLSLDDEFMNYEARTFEEILFKKSLTKAIQSGLKDFYRPVLDPSFGEDGGICYAYGRKPAIGKSHNWWKKTAKDFMPNRGSRLGTSTEYVAFLGVLLKDLVKNGWTKAKAWEAVCKDSKELGHYNNSENAKHEYEHTGSREIVGYYDLGNVYKILFNYTGSRKTFVGYDVNGCEIWGEVDGNFPIAGSCCYCNSNNDQLANLVHSDDRIDGIHFSVGWIVLEK